MARKTRYYQRPDGLYETSRTVRGKRVYFRGKTCAEVDRKIVEYDADVQKGRPFPAVAEEWWKAKEPTVSASTERVYSATVERIKEAFRGRRVSEIKPLDIRRYMAEFEARGFSRSTCNSELTVIKQVFAHAVLSGDTDANPAREVTLSRGLPVGKRLALTVEQERLVEDCRKGDWWLFGLMLLYTGMRRGELLALNWQDIDLAAGVIHVTKKLNYSYGFYRPVLEDHLKSANGKRDIRIFKPLADVLPRDHRIGLVFHDRNGDYLPDHTLRRIWPQYCRDAGLPFKTNENGDEVPAVTPHCFRHSFATICYESGVDPRTAASWMGDTQQVVQGVYEELRSGQVDRGALQVETYLAERRAAHA